MNILHLTAAALLFAMPFANAADFKQPAENAKNPAPTTTLNSFQRFELMPVAIDPPYAGQKGNEVAREYLQSNLQDRVGKVIAGWNANAVGDTPRTLKIEPKMTHVRFISGGKRFFAGGFAGSSWLYVTVKLSDAQTGEVIGEPGFYQSANGMAGAWSFGATDKSMLIRISSMLRAYLQENYDKTVEIPVRIAPEVVD